MNSFERSLAKLSFRGQKKVRIMRQLQRLIKAGVSLSRSLEMLKALYSKDGKKPSEPLALMIGEWQARLGDGKLLSTAMSGWISPAEQMIIEAGEQSEKLASSLEDALNANGASSNIRKTILGGLAYPFVMLMFMVFMLYGFATEIAPAFATIVPPSRWTGNAAIMYDVSNFVVDWAVLIGLVTGGALTAMILSFPVLTGPFRKHLDRIPPYSIYKITQGASYMISLRGFLSAGMPIPEAHRKMMAVGNPYFRERVRAIYSRINMGRNMGLAMKESGYNFPDDDIAGEISIYSDLDDFSDSLDLLAKEWIAGAEGRAATAAKIINTVMLVLIAGTIIYIALSMYELQDLITAAAQV